MKKKAQIKVWKDEERDVYNWKVTWVDDREWVVSSWEAYEDERALAVVAAVESVQDALVYDEPCEIEIHSV